MLSEDSAWSGPYTRYLRPANCLPTNNFQATSCRDHLKASSQLKHPYSRHFFHHEGVFLYIHHCDRKTSYNINQSPDLFEGLRSKSVKNAIVAVAIARRQHQQKLQKNSSTRHFLRLAKTNQKSTILSTTGFPTYFCHWCSICSFRLNYRCSSTSWVDRPLTKCNINSAMSSALPSQISVRHNGSRRVEFSALVFVPFPTAIIRLQVKRLAVLQNCWVATLQLTPKHWLNLGTGSRSKASSKGNFATVNCRFRPRSESDRCACFATIDLSPFVQNRKTWIHRLLLTVCTFWGNYQSRNWNTHMYLPFSFPTGYQTYIILGVYQQFFLINNSALNILKL